MAMSKANATTQGDRSGLSIPQMCGLQLRIAAILICPFSYRGRVMADLRVLFALGPNGRSILGGVRLLQSSTYLETDEDSQRYSPKACEMFGRRADRRYTKKIESNDNGTNQALAGPFE